jgi:uncharacterized protein YpuA (DUF1002 family)
VQNRVLVNVIILVSENRENRHRRLVMLAFLFQRAALQGRRVAAVRYGSDSISMLIRPLGAQLLDARSPFGTNSVGHTGDAKKVGSNRRKYKRVGLDDRKAKYMGGHAISKLLFQYGKENRAHELIPMFKHWVHTVVQEDNSVWQPNAISNAIFGLKGGNILTRSESAELFDLIVRRMETSTQPYDPIHICQIMAGISESLKGDTETAQTNENLRKLLSELPPKIRSAKRDFDAFGAGQCLFSLKNSSSESVEVRQILSAMAEKIVSCTSSFTGIDIGKSLFGLRNMSDQHEEVRAVLSALAPAIERSSFQENDSQALGNAFYGLHNMSSDHVEVQAVVKALSSKLNVVQMDTMGLCNVLYGFKKMSSDQAEVRNVVVALTDQLNTCSGEFDWNMISAAFSGMQRMSGEHGEVRAVVAALHRKMNANTLSGSPLLGNNVANILYGMRNMSSDQEEVRSMLSSLAKEMKNSSIANARTTMIYREFGNAMFGLQNMSSEHPEVRQIVSALAANLNRNQEIMDTNELVNAMIGMRNMSADHAEVRELLSVILAKAQHRIKHLHAKSLTSAMSGLRNMSSEHAEVRGIVLYLAHAVAAVGGPKRGRSSRLQFSESQLLDILSSLRCLSCKHPEVRLLIEKLAVLVSGHDQASLTHKVVESFNGLSNFAAADCREVRELRQALVGRSS